MSNGWEPDARHWPSSESATSEIKRWLADEVSPIFTIKLLLQEREELITRNLVQVSKI
jgi:hypothetical protein